MSHNKKYSRTPVAAAVSAALVAPAAALAQEEGATAALDEIIVSARKREENLQKIPASIHALPEAMLKEMGALNTEDYVRFMPSVNWINFNSLTCISNPIGERSSFFTMPVISKELSCCISSATLNDSSDTSPLKTTH